MRHDQDRPLSTAELIELDDLDNTRDDGSLWGHVNEYAYAFTADQEPALRRTDIDGVYSLAGRLTPGVPVEEDLVGETYPRTLAERHAARAQRLDIRAPLTQRSERIDGFRPEGARIAYLPRTFATVADRAAVGVSARGGTVHLSTTTVLTTDGDNHSLVIDGESRQYLRPEFYPYRAVCKLELYMPDGKGAWAASGSYATGFLVGRRILMTSGHAFEGASLASGTARIRVIPACWANQPVYGPGLVTWVRRRLRWHSDSGNDLQICQLADPIGDRMGYFGTRDYDSDWEDDRRWTMAGFPYDRSKYGMSVQYGIAVRDDDDGDDISVDGRRVDSTQVENDADEASGASGSPLFGWFGKDNPCAIGVHSGYQEDGTLFGSETWSCAAGGAALNAIVSWGRANWD